MTPQHPGDSRALDESRIAEQMVKDLRESKWGGCGCMVIVAILLFTTTTFLGIPFIPFAGPLAGAAVLVITLIYILLPAEVQIWYWRAFKKDQYEKARQAAISKLSATKKT